MCCIHVPSSSQFFRVLVCFPPHVLETLCRKEVKFTDVDRIVFRTGQYVYTN